MKRNWKISFRIAISSVTLLLIIITSTTIGVFNYQNNVAVVDELSGKLFQEIYERVYITGQRQFEGAHCLLQLNKNLYESGQIPLCTPAHEAYVCQVLAAYQGITCCGYGDTSGSAFWSYRYPNGQIYFHKYTYDPHRDKAVFTEQLYRPGQPFITQNTNPNTNYNCHLRPWYAEPIKAKAAVWTDPYIFVPAYKPGITHSTYLKKNGTIFGAISVDIELEFLSETLKVLKIGQSGRAIIVNKDGNIIGHPNKNYCVNQKPNGQVSVAHLSNTRDTVATALYHQISQNGFDAQAQSQTRFTVNQVPYWGIVKPFNIAKGINWALLIVIPENELLGRVKRGNRITLIVSLLALLIGTVAMVWFSSTVSKSFMAVYKDMDKIRQLDLREIPYKTSFIKEVNDLRQAVTSTKRGLRSFEKYVPASLVRLLLRQGQEAKIGGKKQNLTIFFSDIADFTTISEQLGPEKLVELLGEYLSHNSQIIIKNQGTVDKYIGDAIMAFWGAPTTLPNHAYLCCKSALECQAFLDALEAEYVQRGLPPFRSRIGINTGELIVGNLGAENRLNYTVIGDSVNLAARLEGINKFYGTRIIISQYTYQAVKDQVVVRLLDYVNVKGKETAVKIYELMALEGQATAQQLAIKQNYEKGYQLYLNRQWQAATDCFNTCLLLNRTDKASNQMLNRCQTYAHNPPPSHWNGIFKFNSK